jgi:fucose permease
MNRQDTANHSLLKLLPVLFSFFVMGFVDVVGISVSYVKKDFALNDSTANLLPMLVFLWFAVCSLPAGIVMKRIGRKKTALISAVITAAGMIMPLLNYSFLTVLTAFALLGVGNTILQVSLNPLVTNVTRADRLTGMLTLGQFIKAISSALGPVLAGFAAATLGNWKYIFPAYAAVTAVSFVWLLLTPIREEKLAETVSRQPITGLFRDKYLLMLFTAILLSVGFEVGLMTAVPKYFQASYGLSLEEGGYACTLYFIARTIGTFGGAILLGRLPVKKFFTVSLIIGISGFLVFLFAVNTVILYVSLFVIGLSCANIFAIAFSTALQYKEESADGISAMMIIGVSGGALIPPLMGILADATTQQVSLLIPLCALVYILYCSIRIKH